MNILITSPNNNLGGAEQYLKMITAYYSKQHKINVCFFFRKVADNPWEDIKNENITFKFYSNKREVFGMLNFFWKHLFGKKNNYDYVFTSNVYTTGLLGFMMKLGLLKTKKFIARESTSIFLRYKGLKAFKYIFFYKLGYQKVDLLICQTNLMRKQLVEQLPFLTNRTKTIGNPIDLGPIEVLSKEKLNVKLPKEYIVTAGRLKHEKGYDILINAFKNIKKSHPKLKLIILGQGNLKDSLTELSVELGLSNDVIFQGFVSNVYPFFKNAKACVVSSRVEGFPNVLLQMMSQNEKVISTLCAGGIEDIPGIFTCEVNNPLELENSIDSCINNDTSKNKTTFDSFLRNKNMGSFISQIENS